MARQKQYVRNAIYEVIGPSGLTRRLKYVDKYTFARDTFRLFRQLRPAKKRR
jgi:hypothetical protein